MTSRLLSLSFLIGLTLVLSAGLASAERRVALIIGNSTYKSVQPLANPARDAAAWGRCSRRPDSRSSKANSISATRRCGARSANSPALRKMPTSQSSTMPATEARLCPLVCGKGFRVEEDRCVAEACRRGFVRNKASGECERETRAAASPASRDEGGGGSGGGGQIFCSERGGCSAVPKNCRIVHGGGTGGTGTASVAGQRLVCN